MAGLGRESDWTDMQIQRLVGSSLLHPIVIERTRTACKDAYRRVEHNQVRNVATREKGPAIRVRPLDDSHYVAVVLPVMLDGNFTLVGRYRHAIDRWSIELPRAHCRSDESGWKRMAEIELLEPIGLRATKMALLGALEPDTSLTVSNTIVILAEGCIARESAPAIPRQLIAGTVQLSGDELGHLVRRGDVTCGITLAALYLHSSTNPR